MIAQRMHVGIAAPAGDTFCELALLRAAQNEHAVVVSLRDPAGKLGEVIHRPVLGRAERSTRIEADHPRPLPKAGMLPDRIGGGFVARCSVQLHTITGISTSGVYGEAVVGVDDR